MLRLIRLVYPNSVRPRLFTEFAMETTRDSIKYIRPVYTNSASGGAIDKTFDDYNLNGGQKPSDANYRKAMYETTESRYGSELVNGQVIEDGVTAGIFHVNFNGKTVDNAGDLTATDNGAFALGYIDGSGAVFAKGGYQQPIATQDKTGRWFYAVPGVEVAEGAQEGSFVLQATGGTSAVAAIEAVYGADSADTILAYGRFDSERDLTGQHLGEVELIMDDYQFVPRPYTLGVTMTQLAQITLDASFGVSGEELLLDYAGQEIKKSLDYSSVRDAYRNSLMNSNLKVDFDAEAGAGTMDAYGHTAQLITQAVETVGDRMYDDIKRGGVSHLVGGPSAVTYLRLNTGFTTKGAQVRNGAHQVGELHGIPVFKVPSDVIPSNELVTCWKNAENDADVGQAYGVLVPFVSTGMLQRKNFYAEAGLATYQDHVVLQPKYYGRIVIDNIREG